MKREILADFQIYISVPLSVISILVGVKYRVAIAISQMVYLYWGLLAVCWPDGVAKIKIHN